MGDRAVPLIGGLCLTTDIAKATTGTLLPSRWSVRDPLQKYHW